MTRSAPESPGRGCPIAISGKNSMPHTAYYPTVESLVESQIGTSNADESVQAFGEKITTVIEYTPTQKQLPWHEIIYIGRRHAFGSHLIRKHFQCIPCQNLVAPTLTQTWPCSQPSSQRSQPLVKQPAN